MYLAALSDKCFFLSLSMILLGFIAVYEWEMLLPDRKDYLILTSPADSHPDDYSLPK